MYTFMSLKLHTLDMDIIDASIANKVQQAPGFFKDSPVVVDLSEIEAMLSDGAVSEGGEFDVARLFERVKSHKLVPIVASVTDKSSPFAASIALPLMEAGIKRHGADSKQALQQKKSDSNEDTDKAAKAAKAANKSGGSDTGRSGVSLHMGSTDAESNSKSSSDDAVKQSSVNEESDLDLATAKQVEVVVKTPMLITRPVRSGQQVFARDTDLIVMGPVGAGAEVLADQNIHVYGPLRGRALCGVSGNSSTRIFCQSLEAELVSVDGNFRLLEEIPSDLRGKPAQIWLDNGRLNIEPLVDSNLSGVIA